MLWKSPNWNNALWLGKYCFYFQQSDGRDHQKPLIREVLPTWFSDFLGSVAENMNNELRI